MSTFFPHCTYVLCMLLDYHIFSIQSRMAFCGPIQVHIMLIKRFIDTCISFWENSVTEEKRLKQTFFGHTLTLPTPKIPGLHFEFFFKKYYVLLASKWDIVAVNKAILYLLHQHYSFVTVNGVTCVIFLNIFAFFSNI